MAKALVQDPALMTVDEFLAWDGGGHVGRLELVDGVVRAMAPASATHSILQGNIVTAINNHLRATGRPCRAGTEAPVIPPLGKRVNARAPDIAVTCTPPSSSPTFDDPLLIVEILSPSNEAATWESIRALAGLQSLVEIVTVSSTEIAVQIFRRGPDGNWLAEPTTAGPGDTAHLVSIGLELAVAEVYRQTALPPPPA